MKLKFLKTVGLWGEGEVFDVADVDAKWLTAKKLAEPVKEEPSFEDLFEEEVKPKPEHKPKTKIQPANKANKAPENK